MMCLRNLARSAPRALSRASSTVVRSQVAGRTSSLLQPTRTSAFLRPQQTSAFSTTITRMAAPNDIEGELSEKLASEIKFEEEVKATQDQPASITDYLQNGPFKVQDTPGKEEVVLTRTYGNEKITVTFSIADLQSMDQDMFEDDSALGDETSSTEAEEERLAEEAEEEQLGEEPSVPCRLNVVVEKPGKGALAVEALAQDGAVVVENLYYYEDAKLAHAASADASHAAENVYPGPPFGSLDEDLQILMERYLEERGITTALAVFVPDYMDMKEQREYLAWLNNVKSFVDTV